MTFPEKVPTATWSHPCIGCHATLRPRAGRRAWLSIFLCFNDQKRTLRSSPTVANRGNVGCMARSQTSPSSRPVFGSIVPQWPCTVSFAVLVAASSFCAASPTTSMLNSMISDVDRPTASLRPSEEAATAFTLGDFPEAYVSGAQRSSRIVSATREI